MLEKRQFLMRNNKGFTLAFSLLLALVFASLLGLVFYFLKLNSNEVLNNLNKDQSLYLAESGNNRALAKLNIKSLPEIDIEDDEGFEAFEDDELFEEDDFASDFSNDEDSNADESLFDDEENDEDSLDSEEKSFLARIPRYVNFYHKNPFYINIDSGAIINEAEYLSLVSEQQKRIQTNRQAALSSGEKYIEKEVLIEEAYFPLPEVNVQKIGSIKFAKGTHLRPGMKLILAQKVPVKLKQKDIIAEYTGDPEPLSISSPRPILRTISPNFARPGEEVDVSFDGDNLEGFLPEFSSVDIALLNIDEAFASIQISENAKLGKIKARLGPNRGEFFIVPKQEADNLAPIITNVFLEKAIGNQNQFIEIDSKEKIKNIKIVGENLSLRNEAPVIVPDAHGISIDLISYSPKEILINIESNKAKPGIHYFSIFTPGGQSLSWSFNVNKEENIPVEDPLTGTYSTVLTLLEVNSLSNLPIKSLIEGSSRPEEAGTDTNASKRPSSSDAPNKTNLRKTFDLLRSDLELVWLAETIATVNKKSYKETRIIRRSVPRVEAALTTNSELSFGQSSLVIEGALEASTRITDYISVGETSVAITEAENDRQTILEADSFVQHKPIGKAVVENLKLNTADQSPKAKGFRVGGIVSILSSNPSNAYSDFAFIEAMNGTSITVKKPGFSENHLIGDEIIQFYPSVISPEAISERDAQRSLDPPGSIAFVPGRVNFDYVFHTSLDKIIAWTDSLSTNTTVPTSTYGFSEGYFGLNIIDGSPNFSGSNALYGQGTLIIDTTSRGRNPFGGTVTLGGSSKIPSLFEGVIYILGNLQITGPVQISGGIIVQAPGEHPLLKIGGSGNISHAEDSIKKSIIHLPFLEEPRTRKIEKVKNEETILNVKN